MCLLVFSVNPNASDTEWFLILISVRDEIYTRPTKRADFWDSHPGVIGGRDLEPGKEGGTWLAMSKNGKIGALLNILQPDKDILPSKKGRGFLAADFVCGQRDCLDYLKQLLEEKDCYNQYLLFVMENRSLMTPKIAYYTNSSPIFPILLNPGTHAFGNSITPDTPWPKVSKAKELFLEVISHHPSPLTKDSLVEELFSLLRNRTEYPLDDRMRKQGAGKSIGFLKKLSAIFVEMPEFDYGSRCHTVILIDGFGNVDYYEKSRPEVSARVPDEAWRTLHYTFKQQDKSN